MPWIECLTVTYGKRMKQFCLIRLRKTGVTLAGCLFHLVKDLFGGLLQKRIAHDDL